MASLALSGTASLRSAGVDVGWGAFLEHVAGSVAKQEPEFAACCTVDTLTGLVFNLANAHSGFSGKVTPQVGVFAGMVLNEVASRV